MTQASLARQFLESAICMGESWLSILSLGPSTRSTETSCRAVCTAGREGLEEARNSPDCAPCCSITAVSSCKDHPIPSPNWRACALTPLPYFHRPSLASRLNQEADCRNL